MNDLLSIALLLVALAFLVRLVRLSGRKNGLIYAKETHLVHDVQEAMGRAAFVAAGAAASAVGVALVGIGGLVCGLLLAAAVSLVGDFYFQVEINRALGRSDIDEDEPATWTSPRRGYSDVRKWFYGARRRYQRPVAGFAVAVGLCLLLLF